MTESVVRAGTDIRKQEVPFKMRPCSSRDLLDTNLAVSLSSPA